MRNPDQSSASVTASFGWRPLAGTATALSLSAAAIALLGAPGTAHADYRLLFVTSGSIDATSSDIATYNSFATTQAALNARFPSTTWSAIVSTASVNAVTNIDCGGSCDSGVPLYLPGGTEVAASTDDFFGNTFLNAPDQNQFGATATSGFGYAWNGSNSDGTAATGFTMGDPSGYTAQSGYDVSGFYFGTAITNVLETGQYPIYVISGDISGDFPGSFAAVPEPEAGAALLLGGLIVTGIFRHRRSRRAPAEHGLA